MVRIPAAWRPMLKAQLFTVLLSVLASCGDSSDGTSSNAPSITSTALSSSAPAPGSTTDATTAGRSELGIYPINASPLGKTYPQWVAEWWKWADGLALDVHPLAQ